MTDKILIAREGAILRLALNRPEKKNAIDREMYRALIAALDEASRDKETRVALISGAGGAFSAGNDLQDFRLASEIEEGFEPLRFVRALAAFEKPLVAAVAGEAVGVGATLLFHCDLVYAAPSARFSFPFIDLGLVPEAASSLLAPRRFGHVKAAQYLMLGERFDAQEALRLNLINAIAPEEELIAVASDAATRLAQKPLEALMATRRLMRGDPKTILARIDEEALLFRQALTTPETRARLEAFFNRQRQKA